MIMSNVKHLTNIDDLDNNIIKTKKELMDKLLSQLGYRENELKFENMLKFTLADKKVHVSSDIEIFIEGKVQIVIDVKSSTQSLTEKDILQTVSYAKLISVPQAVFAVITNGEECVVVDSYSGKRTSQIPTKAQLLEVIGTAPRLTIGVDESREIESTLFTIHNAEALYRVIQECKDVIEKKGLIRSDQSFKEMTKILLIKMNEERRVREKEGKNRFNCNYIASVSEKDGVTQIEAFKGLFEDAKKKYPSIYSDVEETIIISDESCIKRIVKNLELFSFLGTGDDIKGAAYEIFLKSTLRGEFDQYFTPREIVDFMVKFADPNVGDVILDPACGSGGFLIQAFNFVRAKINSSDVQSSSKEKKFNGLVEKCLWGHEADYDLHVLAKINLIMHGDGWNNIFQGDTLSSINIPEEHFDLILANPPFTIPYTFKDVLNRYELGMGKEREELDILFVEKSIRFLKPCGDLFIVLPEGLLNNKKYFYFREWLLKKVDLLLIISLPEGAFKPFGESVSKTCILGVRKKGVKGDISPEHVFLGKANEIGYVSWKKKYKHIKQNDLQEFEYIIKNVFDNIKHTSNKGECGWIEQKNVSDYRIDANYLLNKINKKQLQALYQQVIPLSAVCNIDNHSTSTLASKLYHYLEVPDISPQTGSITNIRRMTGDKLGDSFHKFWTGDILFTRINPRINRVAIAPDIEGYGIMSKEIYRIVYKKNKYISEENKYVICSLLQSEMVIKQVVRLSTGSSSSRARVQIDDLLNDVFVPVMMPDVQKKISDTTYKTSNTMWKQSQKFLETFEENQKLLGSMIDKDSLRGV